MYNPKEYWKRELGGVDAWCKDADTSNNIVKSIERMKTVVIPKILELKKTVGGNILDAGCGSGFCTKAFYDSKLWDNCYGIDFQEHRIEYSRKKYNYIDFTLGDLTNLPYADGFFDVIYTGAVLMHLPVADKIKAIGEFKRVLADGGFYFGHEVVQNTENEIMDTGIHVINPNLSWLKKTFHPLNVEILILNHNNNDFQIIYAQK